MILRNKLLLTFLSAVTVITLAGYPFGFHPTDYGFIDSLSYRIYLSQVPYIDFHYVRPPISPYFHSIPIYLFGSENLLLTSRISFYMQLALISYIGSLIFTKINFVDSKHLYYLATTSFLLSVHNFPSASWHTLDGIFFSILSIYFLVSGIKDEKDSLSFISGLLIVIAALTKQSFYPLPFIFLIAIFMCNFRHALFYLVGTFVALLIFYLYLIFFGNFSEFLSQTSSTSNVIDAIESIYIGFSVEGIGLAAMIISFTFFTFLKNRYSLIHLDPLLITIGIAIFTRSIISIANISIMKGQYIDLDAGGFNSLLLVFTVVYFFKIVELEKLKIDLTTLTFITSISLMIFQMISWGYAKPMLFILPGLALFLKFHERSSGINFPIKSSIFILICSLIFSVNLYRDSPKFLATKNLGDLYPRLDGIHVGKQNYLSYELLKEIQGEESVETVLPTFTLFNYFTEHATTYPIDWSKEGEMPKDPEYYFANLSGKKVIIESGCDTRLCAIIRQRSKKLKENYIFALYQLE